MCGYWVFHKGTPYEGRRGLDKHSQLSGVRFRSFRVDSRELHRAPYDDLNVSLSSNSYPIRLYDDSRWIPRASQNILLDSFEIVGAMCSS